MNQNLCDAKQKIIALQNQLLAITDLEAAITAARIKFDADIIDSGIEFFLLLSYVGRIKSKLLAAVAGHQQSMTEAAR